MILVRETSMFAPPDRREGDGVAAATGRALVLISEGGCFKGEAKGLLGAGMLGSEIWSDRLLGIVSGQITSGEIEHWVDTAWTDGHFVDAVSGGVVGRLPTAGRPVARYGDSGLLRSAVCFTHLQGPGGVVVHTPPPQVAGGMRRPYCIAPHVHQTSHVTVVLQGAARFFIARREGRDARIVCVPVRAGEVLLCPAGIAHTFGSKRGAFTVLSIQARFVEPSQPDFARNVSAFEGLPVVVRAAGRRKIPVPSLCHHGEGSESHCISPPSVVREGLGKRPLRRTDLIVEP